jgi:hypothetical protein
VSLAGRAIGGLLKLVSGEVLADAEEHVRRVRATDLDWTVVRPPRLTQGDPEGSVRHGTDLKLGFESVDRADLASFLLDVVEEDLYVREMPKVGSA